MSEDIDKWIIIDELDEIESTGRSIEEIFDEAKMSAKSRGVIICSTPTATSTGILKALNDANVAIVNAAESMSHLNDAVSARPDLVMPCNEFEHAGYCGNSPTPIQRAEWRRSNKSIRK